MSNILVTGANGQLGLTIKDIVTQENFIFTDKDELDILDFKKVEEFCKKNSIKTIINCASYTAVDMAEKEKEKATNINYKAVENLAKIAKNFDIQLIHFSTDYVYDGKNYQAYTEDDRTNPVNFYGYTKLKGEEAIKRINPKNSIIIRTSWVYSKYGKNFVKTMLKLTKELQEIRVIFDQVGTPTYAKDLAKVILDIIPLLNHENVKIYNYSNEGVCSWYDFAYEIVKLKNKECKILPIHTYEYPTLAKRPHFSLLDKTKIKENFQIEIPHWRDSLESFLSQEI